MIPQLFEILKRGGRALAEVAFPNSCVECGALPDSVDYPHVCMKCSQSIRLVEDPRCRTCGYPIWGDAESADFCQNCEHLTPVYEQCVSLVLFKGAVRGLVHALKYEQGLWALRDIRVLMENASWPDGFSLEGQVVAVPLHPRKLRERGYNQSELIARELCSVVPGFHFEQPLERVLDTESQTKFDKRDRRRNLKNAFSLRSNRAIDPAKRYLIIDDVFTTGSTINACASALRKAGARRIDALTVGHG
ncbi:ComF family protein [Puniceicoccaceae bacterium K14]|nr:ComF family protein [Puniceicoccaceae bacterium K14]